MDSASVQALISGAISPLLTRIELLEAENKEIKDTLSKIPIPKVSAPRNAPSQISNKKLPPQNGPSPKVPQQKKQEQKKEEKNQEPTGLKKVEETSTSQKKQDKKEVGASKVPVKPSPQVPKKQPVVKHPPGSSHINKRPATTTQTEVKKTPHIQKKGTQKGNVHKDTTKESNSKNEAKVEEKVEQKSEDKTEQKKQQQPNQNVSKVLTGKKVSDQKLAENVAISGNVQSKSKQMHHNQVEKQQHGTKSKNGTTSITPGVAKHPEVSAAHSKATKNKNKKQEEPAKPHKQQAKKEGKKQQKDTDLLQDEAKVSEEHETIQNHYAGTPEQEQKKVDSPPLTEQPAEKTDQADTLQGVE